VSIYAIIHGLALGTSGATLMLIVTGGIDRLTVIS
jgi:hypothetical protein